MDLTGRYCLCEKYLLSNLPNRTSPLDLDILGINIKSPGDKLYNCKGDSRVTGSE